MTPIGSKAAALTSNPLIQRANFRGFMSKISTEAFNALTDRELPIASNYGFRAEEIGEGTARVRAPFNADFTRPGGTISGPVMMALTDFGMYAALLGAIGEVPLAVTTNLNINFLRLPAPVDVVADCNVIKLGRRLAVIEVTLRSDGDDAPIAHATGTYSIPPDAKR